MEAKQEKAKEELDKELEQARQELADETAP